LAEHDALRGLYDGIEQVADSVLAGEPVEDSFFRERCRALRDRVLQEMDAELAELGPVLRDADAFGDVRHEQLRGNHEAQRDAVLSALGDAGKRSALELAGLVKALLPVLRGRMSEQERSALDADVLKDDPIDIAGPTS
jgi:hypothetical protein